MAIGVDNNDIVGPNRRGPRNRRRSPLVANTVFYPALMWTPRFIALSGDPFNPTLGFNFPGQVLPAPDATRFHNSPIQAAVDARLNSIPEYLERFGLVFNGGVPLPAAALRGVRATPSLLGLSPIGSTATVRDDRPEGSNPPPSKAQASTRVEEVLRSAEADPHERGVGHPGIATRVGNFSSSGAFSSPDSSRVS